MVLFVGFGGGLSWGAVAWRWSSAGTNGHGLGRLMRVGVIFPGQGSQVVGMGVDVARAYPAAAACFGAAKTVLGYDLLACASTGPRTSCARPVTRSPRSSSPTSRWREPSASAGPGRLGRALVRRVLLADAGRLADLRVRAVAGQPARPGDAPRRRPRPQGAMAAVLGLEPAQAAPGGGQDGGPGPRAGSSWPTSTRPARS